MALATSMKQKTMSATNLFLDIAYLLDESVMCADLRINQMSPIESLW